jgi:hypothetical protein
MAVLLSKMFTLMGRHFGLAPRRRTGRMPKARVWSLTVV